jgi:hypothetical protein
MQTEGQTLLLYTSINFTHIDQIKLILTTQIVPQRPVEWLMIFEIRFSLISPLSRSDLALISLETKF